MNAWQTKKFEDCLEKVVYTNKIQRKDFLTSGDFPVISQEAEAVNGYWDNEEDLFRIKRPVVIFGDHTQVLKYVDFDFVLGADGVKILQPKNFLDSKFFYYFLQNVDLKSLGYARHYKLLKDLEIPLPPLAEQERIVKILDEVLLGVGKARENAEKNLKNSQELFESYLQNIFANPKWEEKTLGEIATFRNGMNFTKGSKGEEIKIVGVRDFQKSFWVPTESLESVIIDGELSEIDFLRKDDILTVRSNGNPELIGRTLLAGDVAGKVSHSGFTIRIRLNSKNVYPEYLCRYLKSQKARKELVASGTGINIKSLNQQALSSLVIPIPAVAEQKAIVKKLDALSEETKKLEAIYRQKLADLDELKKSVLKQAFSGEL